MTGSGIKTRIVDRGTTRMTRMCDNPSVTSRVPIEKPVCLSKPGIDRAKYFLPVPKHEDSFSLWSDSSHYQ